MRVNLFLYALSIIYAYFDFMCVLFWSKFFIPMFKGKRRPQQLSGETVRLGEYIHSCGDLIIVKLSCKNPPFPNAPVLVDNKQIGKVDEIFGTLDESYISIETQHKNLHKEGQVFDGYKEKFIYKDRLLPREETMARKEKEDKAKPKGNPNDYREKKKFNKFNKGGNNKGGYNNKGNFNNDKRKKEFRSDKFKRMKQENPNAK